MVTEQADWNARLAEALRLIGVYRVCLTYRRTKTRDAFTKYVAIIGPFDEEIIGFLGRISMLKQFLGIFTRYSQTKEGRVVASYLVRNHLSPLPMDCCYELDDQIFNELAMRIGHDEMPRLRSEITPDGPTLIPVEPSMVSHADWPYGP